RPVDLPRERRDPARGARAAPAPLLRASAADARRLARPRAARRSLRRRQRGVAGGARARTVARAHARPAPLPAPRRRAPPLPRGGDVRERLPRHPAPRRFEAGPARRGSAGGPRVPDAAHNRQRLRADRADRARRLGDGRGAPGGDQGARAGARAALPGARTGDAAPPRREAGGDRPVRIVRTIREAREALAPLGGSRVGLVPTMGAFHAGHVSLFRAARAETDVVVVSLFVNPTQFGDAADLARYPRSEDRDAAVAAEEGVDLLFAPDAGEMYPEGFQTWIDVVELGSIPRARSAPAISAAWPRSAASCSTSSGRMSPTSARRTRSRLRSSAAWCETSTSSSSCAC